MEFQLEKLIRSTIKQLVPYSSARDEFSGSANIFLDANENSYGSVGSNENHRYPDPYQTELKKKISQLKNTAVETIFVGNGSDEAIDLLYRIFCEPGKDNALIMPPTYGMYAVSAAINDVEIIEVPLSKGFSIDVDAVLENANSQTKLIWICSPNNPSANLLNIKDITSIIEQFEGLVVIDEAYIDFSGASSWIDLLKKYPNLVVLQTFSKAWGLANLRVGTAYASPEIIGLMNRVKPPYNVNGMTQKLVCKAIDSQNEYKEKLNELIKQREILISNLHQIAVVSAIYPSNANFILVKTLAPKEIYNYLLSKNIVVRDRSKLPLCEGCLRITVGTQAENQKLIQALKEY